MINAFEIVSAPVIPAENRKCSIPSQDVRSHRLTQLKLYAMVNLRLKRSHILKGRLWAARRQSHTEKST